MMVCDYRTDRAGPIAARLCGDIAGAVLILGMHRSGTSCLAGSLQQGGLYLGKVVEWAPHNLKGNRENLEIRALNDAVLEESRGAWNDPPETVIWSNTQKKLRDRLIASFPRDRPWGFKDPRTLLTLDGWLEALPGARFVGTFRHPAAVSQSLLARDRVPPVTGQSLWLRYNKRLMDLYRQYRFPLVCFDQDGDNYQRAVSRSALSLGLRRVQREDTFFDPELRQNRSAGFATASAEAMALYEELQDAMASAS